MKTICFFYLYKSVLVNYRKSTIYQNFIHMYVLIFVMDVEKDMLCVICNQGENDENILNQIGKYWNPEKGTENPFNTLIAQATKCGLDNLSLKLSSNKDNKTTTYIHHSCRTKLRNQTRSNKRELTTSEQSSSSKRICGVTFDFKAQCFYCGDSCKLDKKHPGRNKFVEVRTISTNIHKQTLEICKTRNDKTAKDVETRLITVSDLVAAEARYHVACRTNFENPTPEYKTPGRPVSSRKMELFVKACEEFVENDLELYTVAEFHNLMATLGDNIYTVKMTQIKLKEKYKNSIQLVSREGKSNIILLNRAADILGDKWYSDRKQDASDESARIIETAAVLLKEAIKNHDINSTTYPSSDDIKAPENQIPSLLKLFMEGLFSSPLKVMTLSQAIVSATRPRTIMPLQFGLAVCTDNQIGSKWLNVLLSRLGLAVSYDEVRISNFLFI